MTQLLIILAITMGVSPSRTLIKHIAYYFLDIIFIIIQIYLYYYKFDNT